MHILGVLLAVFKAWMLIDAMKRYGSCRCSYWPIICWIPFGDWAYFFIVKIKDPEFKRLIQAKEKPKSSTDLEMAIENLPPTFAGKLALAQSYYREGKFESARNIARDLVALEPEDSKPSLLLACSSAELKDYDGAKKILEKFLQKNLSIHDYEIAAELVKVYCAMGDRNSAVELLKKIVKESSQLQFSLQLAKLLKEKGEEAEAKAVLRKSLIEIDLQPPHIKKREAKQVAQINKILA